MDIGLIIALVAAVTGLIKIVEALVRFVINRSKEERRARKSDEDCGLHGDKSKQQIDMLDHQRLCNVHYTVGELAVSHRQGIDGLRQDLAAMDERVDKIDRQMDKIDRQDHRFRCYAEPED